MDLWQAARHALKVKVFSYSAFRVSIQSTSESEPSIRQSGHFYVELRAVLHERNVKVKERLKPYQYKSLTVGTILRSIGQWGKVLKLSPTLLFTLKSGRTINFTYFPSSKSQARRVVQVISVLETGLGNVS